MQRKFRLASRAALKRLGVLFLLIAIALAYGYWSMIVMPGSSHRGPLPPASPEQQQLAERLRTHVAALAGEVGQRSTFQPRGMAEAATYIITAMRQCGYTDRRETFVERGARTPNMEFTLGGTTDAGHIVVIGAHYDTFQGTPGADDNASGVAACIELAPHFAAKPQARTIRFVFFVNEEPPAFWTPDMGSWVYAKKCRAENDRITAMLSLETMGYYDKQPGTQLYPSPLNALYPDTGDFIGFVGNYGSRSLVKRAIRTFRTHAQFPSEGAAPPAWVPGVGWSDHWSFWQEGYDAIMVTDTAPFRNIHYHNASDKPGVLDYDRFSRVVEGLRFVIADLASD